jgi:hypothetical protein
MSIQDLNKVYLGFVASMPDPNGKILVYCPEFMPHNHSNFEAGAADTEIIRTMEDGRKVKDKIHTTNCLTAIYRGQRTNVSRPDIYIGETVKVFNTGEGDEYRWDCLGHDDWIRENEHYRVSCADKKITIKDLNDENTYFLEIDTYDGSKHIKMQTSNSDGEAHIYKMEIDTETCTVIITDEMNNRILMETDRPRIIMHNTDGTLVDINRTHIFLHAYKNWITMYGDKEELGHPYIKLINEFFTELILDREDIYVHATRDLFLQGDRSTTIKTPLLHIQAKAEDFGGMQDCEGTAYPEDKGIVKIDTDEMGVDCLETLVLKCKTMGLESIMTKLLGKILAENVWVRQLYTNIEPDKPIAGFIMPDIDKEVAQEAIEPDAEAAHQRSYDGIHIGWPAGSDREYDRTYSKEEEGMEFLMSELKERFDSVKGILANNESFEPVVTPANTQSAASYASNKTALHQLMDEMDRIIDKIRVEHDPSFAYVDRPVIDTSLDEGEMTHIQGVTAKTDPGI